MRFVSILVIKINPKSYLIINENNYVVFAINGPGDSKFLSVRVPVNYLLFMWFRFFTKYGKNQKSTAASTWHSENITWDKIIQILSFQLMSKKKIMMKIKII